MRSHQELLDRLKQYDGAKHIYTEYGYIAWQVSTGENVELLFIEVRNPGRGYASELVRMMCMEIKPYNSVFVFRRASNETAGYFYRKLGFQETLIPGLYKEDAVLGVVAYKTLCQNLLIK